MPRGSPQQPRFGRDWSKIWHVGAENKRYSERQGSFSLELRGTEVVKWRPKSAEMENPGHKEKKRIARKKSGVKAYLLWVSSENVLL